jgi:hypothetical protein
MRLKYLSRSSLWVHFGVDILAGKESAADDDRILKTQKARHI